MISPTLRLQDTETQICQVYHLGLRAYPEVWALQQQLVQERRGSPPLQDVLLMVEHWPIYTLGQGASLEFVKFTHRPQPELVRVERGGEVTYHCPGQLVGYPILNLHHHRLDLHWYLRQLEAVLIDALAQLDLFGERLPGMTGVWISGRKVAAIGIKVSRWITMHGFALNVCPDLAGFGQIVPCGLRDRPVGSLAEFLPGITVEAVQPRVEVAFAQVFGYRLWIQSPEQCQQLFGTKQAPQPPRLGDLEAGSPPA